MSLPGEQQSVRSVRIRPIRPIPTHPANKGLRPSGGYRTLRSFQATTIIYDATVSFCERFFRQVPLP